MNAAIQKAIEFLQRMQKKDGRFRSLSSTDPYDFSCASAHEALFPTVLIANALPELSVESFLISQKSTDWSWNYWIRRSIDAKNTPYPDDLDDTSLAIAALHKRHPKLYTGKVMANIVDLLTALEVKEGGPYRTWLVPETAPAGFLDVDLAVNANIAYMLSCFDISLPNSTTFFDTAIKKNQYVSPYYYGEYPVLYFLCRAYSGKKKKLLQEYVRSKKPTDVLSTALLLCTGFVQDRSYIDVLVSSQNDDGSWDASAFVIEGRKEGTVWYAGSPEMTTAVCVEALRTQQVVRRTYHVSSIQKHIENTIVDHVKERFERLDEPLKPLALKSLERICTIDKHQMIVLLPYLFAQAVDFHNEELVILLGCANVYGWIAYTIYDDFFDGEGDKAMLSVANLCLREMTKTFEVVRCMLSVVGFQHFYASIIDKIDAANAWEVLHTKIRNSKHEIRKQDIPDYNDLSQLADKSLGHGLGPAAILFAMGYDARSKEITSLLSFFHHYLIARQLNDDAHDWEEDLNNGQVNAVAAMILRKKRKKELKELFWEEIIPDVCDLIESHTKNARKALTHISVMKDPQLFEPLLTILDDAVETTRTERKKTKEFLKAYKR